MTARVILLASAVNVAIGFLPSLVGEAAVVQSVIDADQAAADGYLAGIKQAPELADITTETRIVFGPVASAILAVAESSQADKKERVPFTCLALHSGR